MKVLHIIDTLSPGGTQTVVKGILEQSTTSDNQHLIYALRQTENTKRIDHDQVYIHPSSRKYSLQPLHNLKKIIKEEEITILHCHLFRSITFGYILKRFFFPNINLIIHEHGQIFQSGKMYPLLLNTFHPHIDKVISISQATSEQIKQKTRITPTKIQLLYNFVDLTYFSPENIYQDKNTLRIEHNIPPNSFLIGFASRLLDSKGWREFIKAAQHITEENSNIHFIIAGDGPDKKSLLSDTEDNPQIHYVGYYSDMPTFYAMLDIFAIPSHREGMGLTAIEAQAMNIPVLSADVPALNEIIHDEKDGLLFQVKNAEDLIKKVYMIYNDEGLQKKLVENGKTNTTQYSLDNYLTSLQNIYNSML